MPCLGIDRLDLGDSTSKALAGRGPVLVLDMSCRVEKSGAS